MGQCSANSSQSRHETSIPLSRKRAINLLYKTHNLLFTQDNNAHSQNRYVHLAEYTTSRNTLVLLTTTSGQLSSTPENDLSFTSWNTDGCCSTLAVHKPLKNSHVRRHRNHSNITSPSGNGTTSSTQLSANISA